MCLQCFVQQVVYVSISRLYYSNIIAFLSSFPWCVSGLHLGYIWAKFGPVSFFFANPLCPGGPPLVGTGERLVRPQQVAGSREAQSTHKTRTQRTQRAPTKPRIAAGGRHCTVFSFFFPGFRQHKRRVAVGGWRLAVGGRGQRFVVCRSWWCWGGTGIQYAAVSRARRGKAGATQTHTQAETDTETETDRERSWLHLARDKRFVEEQKGKI